MEWSILKWPIFENVTIGYSEKISEHFGVTTVCYEKYSTP